VSRALIVLVALVVGTPVASAGTAPATSYAVILIDVRGDADASLRREVEAGLTRGVANAGADLLTQDVVHGMLAGKPALVGCESATCLAGIADVVGTQQLLRVRIAANGANYELTLELVDAGAADKVRRRAAACTVCTIADVAALAEVRVYDLLTEPEGAPLDVTITSRPDGAALEISGVGAAGAPWQGKLAPGTYTIDATKPGWRRTRKEVTIADDGTAQLFEIALAAEPPAPRFRTIKWAVAGAAGAALVTSIALIVVDGDPTCDATGATCPRQYATGTLGAVIGVVGLAGAGVSGWMFWTERRDRERGVAVIPVAGGAIGAARWSF
jgi:hypothetical protein